MTVSKTLLTFSILGVLALLAGVFLGLREFSDSSAARLPADAPASTEIFRFRDDVGREIVLPIPVRRVVAFNRYTTEFVRAIAGIEVLVGIDFDVAKSRTYWPGLDEMVVGEGQSNPNYEAIVAAKPDVVLIPRNGSWDEASRVLKPFGIPVVVLTGWDVLKHEMNLAGIFRSQPETNLLN